MELSGDVTRDFGSDEQFAQAAAVSAGLSNLAADTEVSSDSGVDRESTGDFAMSAMAEEDDLQGFSLLPEMDDIRQSRERLAEYGCIRTPLVRLNANALRVPHDGMCGGFMEIYLKLENLQPTGSFEMRGASNALAMADSTKLQKGIVTASTGNFAQVRTVF